MIKRNKGLPGCARNERDHSHSRAKPFISVSLSSLCRGGSPHLLVFFFLYFGVIGDLAFSVKIQAASMAAAIRLARSSPARLPDLRCSLLTWRDLNKINTASKSCLYTHAYLQGSSRHPPSSVWAADNPRSSLSTLTRLSTLGCLPYRYIYWYMQNSIAFGKSK